MTDEVLEVGVDAEVAAAIVAALAELDEPKRDKTAKAGTYSYTYADLAGVMAGVRPVFAKHGLAVMQPVDASSGSITVTTRILHRSGGFYESPPFTLPAAGSAQVIGSAVTYARRYSLLATLGLATEDDDGAAASKPAAVASVPAQVVPGGPSAQLTKLAMAKFDAHDMGRREDRLAFTSAALSREVASWADLSSAEARRVVFALDALDRVDADDQRPAHEIAAVAGELAADLLDEEPER